jgi:N-acyl-D-aspartate/D-glutamate deacylase
MKAIFTFCICAILVISSSFSQTTLNPPPDRQEGEGEGPFERLIIRGATIIDGTGAPPRGPYDIVVEGNKIVQLVSVGVPNVAIKDENRPQNATKEIDAHGSYVMPGFINLHAHVGGAAKSPNAEYPFKLWMAHGITTIRGVPAANVAWTQREKKRSAENKIVAPRIIAFHTLGQGEEWQGGSVHTSEKAKEWVQWCFKSSY